MTTVIDHTFGADKRLSTFWFWIEIFAGTVFTFVIGIYVFFGRRFQIGKKLNGNRILITNGESDLSQELYRQLTTDHECQVISIVTDELGRKSCASNSITCNLSDHLAVQRLSDRVFKDYGQIDILIDNGQFFNCNHHDNGNEIFVQQTSNSFVYFLNLFVNFVPKMLENGGGHIITIRDNQNTVQSMVDCRNEVNELVQHFETGNLNHTVQRTFLHSTVHLHDQLTTSTSFKTTETQLRRSVTEIAEKIIRGIQSEEEVIEIKIKKNYVGLLIRTLFSRVTSVIRYNNFKLIDKPKSKVR